MKKFIINLNTCDYKTSNNYKLRTNFSQFSKIILSLVTVMLLNSAIVAGTATFVGYPNNSTDNTSALISQLQNCDILIIPAGSNYYKFSGTATIPAGKTLRFNSGAKFNVTGNLVGNQTKIIADEYEIIKNTSVINGTWTAENVYVKWFGAVGDGSTDDYTSLKKFFDFLNITSYDWALFGNSKEYYTKTQISHTVKNEIKINGNGSRIFRKYSDLNASGNILVLSGSVATTKNVTTDLNAGHLNLIVDNVSGLTPGMGFTLNSSELFGKEELAGDYWHYHNKGIMSKIVSINGNTITMADTIPFDMSKDYLTSSSLKFYKIEPVTINNLNFGSEAITGSYSMTQLRLLNLFNVTVENVVCDPLGYAGISASSIYNGYFNNISLIRPANWPNKIFGLYGIIASLNVNCVYNNILGRAVTHGIAFTALSNAPSNKVEVMNSDFKADRSGSNGADSHASVWVKFSNCTIWGAQWNWGTVIFDNCEMREVAVDGTNVFNEREGASRGGLQAYFTNCNFYTQSHSSTTSLFYRYSTDVEGVSTNKFTILNSNFYLENAHSYLFNKISFGPATDIQPIRVEGNHFYGSGTLYMPQNYSDVPASHGGIFTFKDNTYSLIYWGNPPFDHFETIDVVNNTPVNSNTSDFWVNWEGSGGNVSLTNNVFVGTCFWIKDCDGNILFDGNNIYNNKLKSTSAYKDRNYLTGNENLVFTNNNLNNTYWTLAGNKTVESNIYNSQVQPDEPTCNLEDIYTEGNTVETGVSMEGVANYTIISRAKMSDVSTNAVQNIVGSSVTKLSFGFNPSGTIPYSKPTLRDEDGSYVSPSLTKFYMDTNWHTYVFIMQNGVLKAYMDGIAMLSYDASSVYSKMYATGTINIGGTNSTEKWRGSIQTFAIYNRALSLSEANSFVSNPNIVLSGELYRLVNSDAEIIASPEALEASNIEETSFTANWNSSTGALGYKLDVSTNSNFTSFVSGYSNKEVGNTTTLSVTGLTAGTTYYYRLRAYNANETSVNSNIVSVTTSEIETIVAPEALEASNVQGTSFNANWNSSTGALGYKLDVATNITFTSFVSGYNNKDVGNMTTVNVNGLSSGTIYYYRLRAYNENVTSVNSNTVSATTSEAVPSDIVAYWEFEENNGNIATDSSGNGYCGTFIDNPEWTVGRQGYAVSLDGNNDRIESSCDSGLDIGLKDISIAAWLKMNPAQLRYPTIVSKGGTSNTNPGYWFYVSGSNIKFVLGDGNTRLSSISNSVAVMDESWHHLVITADRDGNANFYFDGVNVGSNDISSFKLKNITNAQKNLTIGSADGSSTTFFNGKIDGVKIYNRLLGEEEIISLANPGDEENQEEQNPPEVLEASNILETSFTANWNAAPGATGYFVDIATNNEFTSFVSGYNNMDVGNTTAFSVNGLSSGTNYYYRLRAYNSDVTSTNSNTVSVTTSETVPSDLIAYWEFEENSGTIATDSSGNGFCGTLINDPNWSDGLNGYALSYDGVDDKVESSCDAGLDMGTGDFSIAAWVKMNSSQLRYPTIVSKGGTSNKNAGYWFYTSGDKIKFVIGDGQSRVSSVSNSVNVLDDTWHHIAVTADRDGNVTFFLDGENVGNSDISSFNSKDISNSLKSLTIGSAASSSTTFFNGKIDGVRIFNKVLNEQDIVTLATIENSNDNNTENNGDLNIAAYLTFDENTGTVAYDNTEYANNGNLINGASWRHGLLGSAVHFDGKNDKIICENSQNLDISVDDFTILTWVNLEKYQMSHSTIASKGGFSENEAGYSFFINEGTFHFNVSDGSESYTFNSNNIVLVDNEWQQIAVTLDRDGSLTFYLNGKNIGSTDATSIQNLNIINVEKTLMVGSAGVRKSYFRGNMDDFRVYKSSLTELEIYDLFNSQKQEGFKIAMFDYGVDDENNVNVYPNPFNTSLTISLSLEEDQDIQVAIYDMKGMVIKSLYSGKMNNGENKITWDGCNNYGRTVAEGLYVVQIIGNAKVENKTIIKQY